VSLSANRLLTAHFLPLREELRRRFVKAETTLFRVRYESDDTNERKEFLDAQKFDWKKVNRKRNLLADPAET
jgi:DNA primase large subunit